MPDHLEMAGDVIQDLGDVLAHFAQRAAAHAADAARFVHDLSARQRLGQLAAPLLCRGLFPRRLFRQGRSHLGRSLRFGFRRFKFFEFELELLKLAAHALGRGAEAHAPQPRDLDFQLLDLKRFCDEARLSRGEFGAAGDKKPFQLFNVVWKLSRNRHGDCLSASAFSPQAPA
jgi:hypothetical protein